MDMTHEHSSSFYSECQNSAPYCRRIISFKPVERSSGLILAEYIFGNDYRITGEKGTFSKNHKEAN